MIDIKLPGSSKWHNVTVEEARKAKKLREEAELKKLSQGKSTPSSDRERTKVLMLVYSPDHNTKPTPLPVGTNLIDIENSFGCGTSEEQEKEGVHQDAEETAAEVSDGDSDESMNRLLQGRNARNPYQ